VIVDEGHNLKHGFRKGGSSRNRVLSLAFGHPSGGGAEGFSGYRPRARRVLFLSATPIEDDYRQLWNQLDVFGHGGVAPVLKDPKAKDEDKRGAARAFMVRRVTSMQVGGKPLTKNLYRREWRNGGVTTHDEPLAIPDVKQQLAVALVQKKVSELLGSQRFNNSFQIGMLASFESFLETTKVAKPDENGEISNFDDSEQTEDAFERIGIDVNSINRLARDYRRRFGVELPHPKMDALVGSLSRSIATGRKALVFVRRVASVKELQRKLEECYDQHLFARLRSELKPELQPRLEQVIKRYLNERIQRRDHASIAADRATVDDRGDEAADEGGIETFFAWFFRGEGPQGVLSGVTVQRRFSQAGSVQSTFFEDNHIAAVLGLGAGAVWEALVHRSGGDPRNLADDLRKRAAPLLRKVKKQPRRDVFLAFQEATLSLLAEQGDVVAERAKVVLQERYSEGKASAPGTIDAPDPQEWLTLSTFWTELRLRPQLRTLLWPEPNAPDFRTGFREQEQRRELVSAMIRLGNPMIDLYVLTVNRLGSLELRRREQEDTQEQDMVGAFLELLERQSAITEERLTTFRELAEAAENFRLIVDLNVPQLRGAPLVEVARELGRLLREQQPIGGMFGAVNETLVRQFRMPGYPMVLVSTDLLQEGEDLHTFCSSVHHYGISWMPSSMEQRIGRIDRVSSQTERRLATLDAAPDGDALLQVYYPHLQETVEVLQVRRVLDRMQRFIRLMHRDLGSPEAERGTLDLNQEMLRLQKALEPLTHPLESAFPVREEYLAAPDQPLAITPSVTSGMLERFCSLTAQPLGGLSIEWEKRAPDNALMGTVRLSHRQQPFTLLLSSTNGWLVVRCVSPIGRLYSRFAHEELQRAAKDDMVRLGAVYDARFDTYDVTVEADTTLAHPIHDQARVRALISRVVNAADRMELTLLESDQPFATFREDLELEPVYER
jgi:hypothetical protein